MSAAIAVALSIAALGVSLVAIERALTRDAPHACSAPCTVTLAEPIREDGVAWDWLGEGRIRVYRVTP